MNRLDLVDQILSCSNCELHESCTAPVPWRGDPGPVALIGEAPGETEDQQGRPFVGPAGKLLQELLDEFHFPPVGLINTVSCYPHSTPNWDHIYACGQNKTDQITYLDPLFILLMGKVALKAVRPDLDLRRGRARPFRIDGRIYLATYHPAAALRNSVYEAGMRNDLEIFRELIDTAPDEWTRLIPQSCSACPLDAEWFEEDTGLGWCPTHLPPGQQGAYEARQALIAADLDAARRSATVARDAGMAAVEEAADPDWMDEAWDALVNWLKTHDTFFVDDFWSGTQLSIPRESRALGPIVMRASRQGLMEKTGQFRPSVRSNMTEKPVWRSLLRP